MDIGVVTSLASNIAAENVEHLCNNASFEKLLREPFESNSIDSSIKVCSSELGQEVQIDEQDTCMIVVDTTLEGEPHSGVISPLTPMTCVEERADPIPT